MIANSEVFHEKLKQMYMTKLRLGENLAIAVARLVRPVKMDGNVVIADCQNGFYRDSFVSNYLAHIDAVAKECWGEHIRFCLSSETELSQSKTFKRKRTSSVTLDDVTASPLFSDELLKAKSETTESPEDNKINNELSSFKKLTPSQNINKISRQHSIVTLSLEESSKDEQAKQATGDEDTATTVEQAHIDRDLEKHPTSLLPDYNFSNFIGGSSNRIAYSACVAVAQNPGQLNNPLFIYGSTGLGKTHLLNAVGNEIARQHPDWNIIYVSAGDLVNEWMRCLSRAANIRNDRSTEMFRQKYRSCDVLLVDDIQFIARKEQTQIEFFHTFNELYNNKKQIILTSDKFPRDIQDIEDRLKSRFVQGLTTDIEPPFFEDRIAIIDAKRRAMNLQLSKEVVHHIATHVKRNVREIHGVLANLLVMQNMNGKTITIESVNQLIKPMIRTEGATIDIPAIQKAVANHFGLKTHELTSPNRSQRLVVPRHLAMYLAKQLISTMTVSEIADAFGKKDHTTVMHAVKKVEEMLTKDQSLRAAINEIKIKLDHLLP